MRFRSMRGAVMAMTVIATACATPSKPRDAMSPAAPHATAAQPSPAPPTGYVADAQCATCHAKIFDSYQGVGMARSMSRPRADVLIEALGVPFAHTKSARHYDMRWTGGKLLFRRWQLDASGKRIHELELPVDWIIGSGYRSRVYLYRTPSGELYQLPIAWYTQEKKWGMAPGFDRADHEDVERVVRRECLFCHNAYPSVPSGSDAKWAPHTFPESLPEGIGCQRCHGPGGNHIRAVVEGRGVDNTRAAIVNPARLSPERRDSVCFQCHLLPAVEMIGVRRFDRDVYSFRPGELLSDYMLHVDVDDDHRPRRDRFEINHHAYRLTQSACYSSGKLTCIDCHDPHQPLKTDARLARANEVCLRCHDSHPTSSAIAAGDCARCHMPRRRTQDVVHVTMTDHRIQRPPAADLLGPLDEREPHITGLTFFDQTNAPSGREGEIYRAVTLLRANSRLTAPRAYLERTLPEADLRSVVPLLDLIAAELQQRRFAEAERLIGTLPEAERSGALATGWLALAKLGLGRTEEALPDLRKAVQLAPGVPEAHFNLGRILQREGAHEESLVHLTRAIELRPNLVAAYVSRAEALAALGRREDAIRDLQRALAIRPDYARAKEVLTLQK